MVTVVVVKLVRELVTLRDETDEDTQGETEHEQFCTSGEHTALFSA